MGPLLDGVIGGHTYTLGHDAVDPSHMASLGKMILTLQSTSTGVDIFFSLMRSYFCFLVMAFSPCHGSDPLKKNIARYLHATLLTT